MVEDDIDSIIFLLNQQEYKHVPMSQNLSISAPDTTKKADEEDYSITDNTYCQSRRGEDSKKSLGRPSFISDQQLVYIPNRAENYPLGQQQFIIKKGKPRNSNMKLARKSQKPLTQSQNKRKLPPSIMTQENASEKLTSNFKTKFMANMELKQVMSDRRQEIENALNQQQPDIDQQQSGTAIQIKFKEEKTEELQPMSTVVKKKFLVFRPYEDPIAIRPYQPPDRGYYFKLTSDVKIIRYTLEDNGFRDIAQPSQKDWTVLWACGALKSSFYNSMTKYQKVNHFPQSFYLTRKDLMYKSISKLREMHGSSHFKFLPQTFLLPNEFAYLKHAMEKDKHKLWIAKPAASSQGRGIIVTNKLSEIPQKGGSQFIVSEYIANPMVIDGYKFDLRIYVALTSINPLRIYIYEEGLTRFATCKYDALKHTDGKSKQSKYMHLTNYSLNKHNANYQNNTNLESDGTGSKWSVTALKKKLESLGVDHASIWKKIEDIALKTIIAAEAPMFNHCQQYLPYRTNCFELFGFDILIDSFLEPWLIEVNLSPSLACDSPLDLKVKSTVIADLFTLSGIVPVEQRKTGETAQVAMRQGCSYGVYMDLKMTSNKRDSQSVSSKQRKEVKTSMASTAFGNKDTNSQTMTKVNPQLEKQVIKEVEYEFRRRGKFKRIFPSLDYSYYKQFFQEERPLNQLVDQKVMQKKRMAMAMALNQQQARATTANKTATKPFFNQPVVKQKKVIVKQNTDLDIVTNNS